MRVQNRLVWLALGVSGCFSRYDEPATNVEELQTQLAALQAQVDLLSAQLDAKADADALATKADRAELEGLVTQGALDAVLAQKQEAATAATDAELAAATAPLAARLDTLEAGYMTQGALDAALGGLAATYVSYEALESGTFDTARWFGEDQWFDAQVRLERETAPGGSCDADCISALLASYVGPAEGLVTEEELAALNAALRDYVDVQDAADRGWVTAQQYAAAAEIAAERAWVIDQGYASAAEIAAGDAAERAWVMGQGYASAAEIAAGDAAERAWVNGQTFAPTSYVDAGDEAVRAWVQGQGYLTGADLDGMATEGWVAAEYAPLGAWESLDARMSIVEADYASQAELDTVLELLDQSTAALDLNIRDLAEDINDLQDSGGPRIIRDSIELHVPSDFPDMQSAIDSLADVIFAGGYATIVVDPAGCSVVYDAAIKIEHPFGERIAIRSSSGDPSLCVIEFASTGAAFVVADGTSLDGLVGFTFRATQATGDADGIVVGRGANLMGGSRLRVDRWRRGVRVLEGGVGWTLDSEAYDNVEHGFITEGGTLVAARSRASGNMVGFSAVFHGMLSADGGIATGNTLFGFEARDGSNMYAVGATACDNGRPGYAQEDAGFMSGLGSTLVAYQSRSSGNRGSGYRAWGGSTLVAWDSTSGVPVDEVAGCAAGNDHDGYLISEGSFFYGNNAQAVDNRAAGIAVRHGSFAEAHDFHAIGSATWGARIGLDAGFWGNHLLAENNGWDGFHVYAGGVLWTEESVSHGNGGSGLLSAGGSSVYGYGLTASDNQNQGIEAWGGSWIHADDTTVTGNHRSGLIATYGSYLLAPAVSSSANGLPDGPLTLDGSGALVHR
jgi:hypothetical protein